MKSVISASRRTDIPAFYLKWFMDAIKDGQIEVSNPLYRHKKQTVRLDPDSVEWIVFWSRNYAHFIRQREFFKDYELFFHFTILPKTKLELYGLPVEKAINQIRILSEIYSPGRIIWRYDPIVHWIENKTVKTNHTIADFENLCQTMSGFGISRCYFSFAHTYRKFNFRFKAKFSKDQLINPDPEKLLSILDTMAEITTKYNINLYSCCNDALLQAVQVHKGHCIDGNLLNRLNPATSISRAKKPTRQDCGCTASIDVGDYLNQPCRYGCVYCYANPAGY